MLDKFVEKYSVIKRRDATDIFYDTKPSEVELLKKFHRRQVWQIVQECDTMFITPGRSHPNAIGFMATVEGWAHRNEEYYVV